MKKKILSLIMAATITIVTLAGCSSKGGISSSTHSKASASKYKMAMILNDSISDGGWGSSCYQAMMKSSKKYGWQTAYSENVSQSNYVSTMSNYGDQGYNLIFAPGAEYQDAVEQVAKDYPDVDFCILNGSVKTDNIESILPDANQIGYMAGALAGLMSKTNSIGFIGGTELDTTKQKLGSYTKAAKKINPKITVHSAYAGSFTDAAKGKEIAASMINTYNADIFFGDASAVDTGAREALGNSGKRFSIGQPGNIGSATNKIIISSVVTNNSALLSQCIGNVKNGNFGNKIIEGTISNGCLSVGTISNMVPKDVQAQYKEIVEKIKAGTFLN